MMDNHSIRNENEKSHSVGNGLFGFQDPMAMASYGAQSYQRQRQLTLGDLLLENRIVFLQGEIHTGNANEVVMKSQRNRNEVTMTSQWTHDAITKDIAMKS